MHETLLSSVYCDAVQAHPACTPLVGTLQWQTPESKTTTTPPAVTFSARDVVPIGFLEFCTGILEVKLESQSDDEQTNETHLARANLLAAAFADTTATNLVNAVNAANPRRLINKGCVKVGGGRGVEGRRWTSTMLFKVGFSPVP